MYFPLKAGSFVSAHLQGSYIDGLFSIPRKAVYGDGQVLVIDDNNSLQFRKVNPIYADEQNIFVDAGLQEGDRLCLTPLTSPVGGMRVRLKAGEAARMDVSRTTMTTEG